MPHKLVKVIRIYTWPSLASVFRIILSCAADPPGVDFSLDALSLADIPVDVDVCIYVVDHTRLLLLVSMGRSGCFYGVLLKRARSFLDHFSHPLTFLHQRGNVYQLVSVLHSRQQSDVVR